MREEPLNILFTWRPPLGLDVIEAVGNVRIRVTDDRREMLALIPEAEVACVGEFDAELLAAARRLRWVQALSGGVESILSPELAASPLPVTCCKACFAIPAAEHALAVMLAFSRRLEEDLRARFDPSRTLRTPLDDPEELAGKTAGILGMGNLGGAIARRCRSFGMRVLGLARRARAGPQGVDRLFAPHELPELLALSDFVVVAVPLTPLTAGLIDGEQLARMKASAYLIDVSGRPALYDLAALERALRQRRIAGAGLQIVPEDDSPLWGLDNLLISLHRATSRQEVDRCFELFAENLRRYRRGDPLLGLVDKEAGY
jgi:phosphoglycerate dehydrogenase-like enzyme